MATTGLLWLAVPSCLLPGALSGVWRDRYWLVLLGQQIFLGHIEILGSRLWDLPWFLDMETAFLWFQRWVCLEIHWQQDLWHDNMYHLVGQTTGVLSVFHQWCLSHLVEWNLELQHGEVRLVLEDLDLLPEGLWVLRAPLCRLHWHIWEHFME